MNKIRAVNRMHYYTYDYEWIDFHGTIAFVGVCALKLQMLKAVAQIQYCNVVSDVRKGEVLATIIGAGAEVPVHMPVDGRVIEVNDRVIFRPERLLSNNVRNWIAKICPREPYSREGLSTEEHYRKEWKKVYTYGE